MNNSMNYYNFYFDQNEMKMIEEVQEKLEKNMSKTEARIAIFYSSFILLMKEDSRYVEQFGVDYWTNQITSEYRKRNKRIK